MKIYVARDKHGLLKLFNNKPKLNMLQTRWLGEENQSMYINHTFFPKVTFENSPMEVELVIKN